tara:strand:- start:25 stop:948 length:924 start_codon:yes stop_codon:yes gene_type:complete
MNSIFYLIVLLSSFLQGLSINYYKKFNIGLINQLLIYFLLFSIIPIIYILCSVKENKLLYIKDLINKTYDNSMIKLNIANFIRTISIILSIFLNGPGVTCALSMTIPAFTAIFSKLFLHKKFNYTVIMGIIVSFIGVLIIQFKSIKNIFMNGFSIKNIYLLFPLLVGITTAYILINYKNINQTSNDDIFTMSFGALPFMILLFIIYNIYNYFTKEKIFFGIPNVPYNTETIIKFIFTGIITLYGGFLLMFEGLKKLNSIEVAILLATMPVFTFIIQYFMFKMPFYLYQMIGVIVIIIGALVVSYGNQ